jgi:hypothetical protein
MSFAYLTTVIRTLQYDEYHWREKGSKEGQRRHGAKHSKKVCGTLVLNGMKQGPFQQIDDSGEHLLPSVPNCTGGTKTGLILECTYNYRTKLGNEC